MSVDPRAGELPRPDELTDIPRLISAYHTLHPDPSISAQRVSFGTSGHRGSSFDRSYNEDHILAITQAICRYRREHGIDGPLFLGIDTHALSRPAAATALEVLAANDVNVMIDEGGGYTPTPVISHAIITYNRGRKSGLADGIVVTPSHNPPSDGGFKYDPPHGGGADTHVTRWIQDAANKSLTEGLADIERIPHARALAASTTHEHDYTTPYVRDLGEVLDLEAVRSSGLALAVDPLGGAGVDYWPRIAEHYKLPLTILGGDVDPTFRFVPLDWDGRIRMDPSSEYAMRGLLAKRDKFDVAWACDTDHDRHGIVTRGAGLLDPNAYLSAAIAYLFTNRPRWEGRAGIGKTIVSSSMIDRVASRLGRPISEMPVGFKWFVDGLLSGSLAFAGEESAGASFARLDGSVWTTDKDGIILGLLAAEILAVTGRDPGEIYDDLSRELGKVAYERIDAPATPRQKSLLASLSAESISASQLAGEKISAVLTTAPGNGAPIGGIKVVSAGGWFAARPSGTEDVYKLYAESFAGPDHLRAIQAEAKAIVQGVIGE
jgi:phosphoglucomutase